MIGCGATVVVVELVELDELVELVVELPGAAEVVVVGGGLVVLDVDELDVLLLVVDELVEELEELVEEEVVELKVELDEVLE